MKRLPLIILILSVVLFDAFQQKYYLDTFDLHPDGIPVSFFALLRSHAFRWIFYCLVHIPLFVIIFKKLQKKNRFSSRMLVRTLALLVAGLFITLVAISMFNIIRFQLTLSIDGFLNNFLFFFYQKGLTFLMVSGSLLLLTLATWQRQEIIRKGLEIHDLRIEKNRLSNMLQGDKNADMHMKIGNREYVISLSEIIWIQSDDYCVKVHTKDKSYSLRRSMRKLTEQLSPYGFVRVHRSAIFNTNYLDQIDYQNSVIRLKNKSDIPFSKSGIRALKREIQEDSAEETTH